MDRIWRAVSPRALARGLIRFYRLTFSAILGRGCRYLPTCSDYADEAIGRYGLWAGGWMALARICRCNPWGASGHDPVPDSLPQSGRWYWPWGYGRWSGAHISLRLDDR
ncbi:MAG: membrane protein insertion efficiency factor YidD [Rhizobiales bacterium]|nr:membrane protein insertion efficiency factor YidD [Hyphomicrobiales bacterium]